MSTGYQQDSEALGLFVLRVGVGLLMAGHGLGKLMDLIARRPGFPDPLGIGPMPTLAFAVFAELLCALAVVLGFKTRWATVPIIVTMLVATFIHHAADGWGQQELPLLYALAFLTIAISGPGRWAFDGRDPEEKGR